MAHDVNNAPDEASVDPDLADPDEASVYPELADPANETDDDAGVDSNVADAPRELQLEASREAHARLIAESVRGTSALPDVAPLSAFEPRDGTGDALPPAPQHTFLSLMGITLPTPETEEAAPLPARAETRIVNDMPVFQDEESEPPITAVVKPPPRPEPDLRTLQAQVYEDTFRALRTRLEREQRLHGRLVERVARGEASEAELAESRARMRETKEAIEDYGTLLKHERLLAGERAERARVDRYYAVVDRTEADFAALVEAARDMDRRIIELGAARERFHAFLNSESGFVGLRSQAAAMRDPRRALLEAITVWTSQADGIELLLLQRLRGVRALRDQTAAPPTDADRLDVWAENWTRRAIEVARSKGPALPAPESTDDTDDAVST